MTFENDHADASPLFLEIRPGMRKALADAVEAFVALLDQIDGDADLEEEPDLEEGFDREQDLGATGGINQEKTWRSDASGTGTLEFEGDNVADCDREPSLGSLCAHERRNQIGWAGGALDDREEEDENDEAGGDDEPILGATTAVNQDHAWRESRGWPGPDDGEPSLGWTGHGRGHPERALRGYDDDREENIGADDREWCESERGIGDLDGLAEQCPSWLGHTE